MENGYQHLLDDEEYRDNMITILTTIFEAAKGVPRFVVFMNGHVWIETVIFFVDTQQILRLNKTIIWENGIAMRKKETSQAYQSCRDKLHVFLREFLDVEISFVVHDGYTALKDREILPPTHLIMQLWHWLISEAHLSKNNATFFSHVQFKKMLAEQLPDVMDMVNANAKIFKRGSKTRLSAEFCTSQNMEAISEVATETSDVNEVLVMTAMRVMESLSKHYPDDIASESRILLDIISSTQYFDSTTTRSLMTALKNYAEFFEQYPNWPVYSLDLSLEYYERYNIERYKNQCIYHKVPSNMVEWYNERWMNGRWFSAEDKLVAWCGQIARTIQVLSLGCYTHRRDLDIFKA